MTNYSLIISDITLTRFKRPLSQSVCILPMKSGLFCLDNTCVIQKLPCDTFNVGIIHIFEAYLIKVKNLDFMKSVIIFFLQKNYVS